MKQDFLIAGMIRSGTTLLTKMTDAHPSVVAIPSPFMYFFKCIWLHIRNELGLLTNIADPIVGSTYPDDIRELIALDTFEPTVRMTESMQYFVSSQTARWVKETAPKIINKLSNISGETFGEYYENLTFLLGSQYGNSEKFLVGTKECWCERFIPFLQKLNPKLKIIFVIRDPRAVVSSQNSRGKGQQHPILLLARQWRDSVSRIAYINSLFPKSTMVILYEDLVLQPEIHAKKMAEMIGVDYNPKMIDTKQYRDGQDRAWKPNTSFANDECQFFKSSIDKWKEKLPESQVMALEWMCEADMRYWGYKLVTQPKSFTPFSTNDFEVNFKEIPLWLQSLRCVDYLKQFDVFQRQMEIENHRRQLSSKPVPDINDSEAVSLFGSSWYLKEILRKSVTYVK